MWIEGGWGVQGSVNINVNSEPLLEGKFRCIVSDSGIWTKTSTQSTLNITNFLGTGTLVGANAYTGESVQLTLNVFGATPPYTVEWFKNGGASPILTQNGAGPAFVLNRSNRASAQNEEMIDSMKLRSCP